MTTKIEWVKNPDLGQGETLNIVKGCNRKSKGCEKCYAERMAKRLQAMGVKDYEGIINNNGHWTGKITLVPRLLSQPFRWRKPRSIFICSMSDLFHNDVPFEFIAAMYGVEAQCPQHKFLHLTKRPERRYEFHQWLKEKCREWSGPNPETEWCVHQAWKEAGISETDQPIEVAWPLQNVDEGVSVENQATADERIPWLLKTPAAIRWVSYEPALGPVDFDGYLRGERSCLQCEYVGNLFGEEICVGCSEEYPAPTEHEEPICPCGSDDYEMTCPRCGSLEAFGVYGSEGLYPTPQTLDGIIIGCETGYQARPMDLDWARSTRDQCQESGAAFFFKQMIVDGKKIGLPELDGKVWDELPGQAQGE